MSDILLIFLVIYILGWVGFSRGLISWQTYRNPKHLNIFFIIIKNLIYGVLWFPLLIALITEYIQKDLSD